jgi:hypothetical protein
VKSSISLMLPLFPARCRNLPFFPLSRRGTVYRLAMPYWPE